MIYVKKALMESTGLTEMQINNLTEDSKTAMADKIVTKLYKTIQRKSKDIDFPEIESSAGDIKRMDGYKDLRSGINFLEKLAVNGKNKDLEELVRDLNYAEQFLVKYKPYFTKAYSKNNTILKSCYVSTVGVMVQLTAYAISNCVVFINTGVMFEAQVRPTCPKLKKHHGYKCLKELLELMHKNKLDKNFKDCLTLNEAAITLTWLGVTLLLLTSIRGIVYMFITSRVKMSEYLDTIKDYVELNQSNVRDPQIKAKQQKWVNRLEKMRDRISIDQEVASSRVEEEISQENEEDFNTNSNISNDLGLL